MRNDSLILRGIFYNFIFDTSILNKRITRAEINYSECVENCRQYPFSTRPLQNDFALIKDFLVPKLISQDQYEPMMFHADISFDFTKMDFGWGWRFLKQSLVENLLCRFHSLPPRANRVNKIEIITTTQLVATQTILRHIGSAIVTTRSK